MGVKRKYCGEGRASPPDNAVKLDRLKRSLDINIETASAY